MADYDVVNTSENAEETHDPDDFRLLLGSMKYEETNWMSQLLMDRDGRQYIRNILAIQSPTDEVAEWQDKLNAYLSKKNITMDEIAEETRDPDDFRLLFGNAKSRERNWVSQLLMDRDGRRYIRNILIIQRPIGETVEWQDKLNAYLSARGITVDDLRH